MAISINITNVQASGATTRFSGTAAVAITSGQPVYFDKPNSVYKLAGAQIINTCVGVAEGSAQPNQTFFIIGADPNFALGGSINQGNVVVVGNTAGTLDIYDNTAASWYVQVLGVGIGNNRIKLGIVGSNVAKLAP